MVKVAVRVRRRPSILDPQGKAVEHALSNLGLTSISGVRVGKLIEFDVEASDVDAAIAVAREACEKLLSNPVMEDFEIEIEERQVPT